MVDPDIANALTMATIANVIEVAVILFITSSPSSVSQSVLPVTLVSDESIGNSS
jgi:hypothetical protein